MAQVRQLHPGGKGIVFQAAHIIQIRCAVSVREKGKGFHDCRRKSFSRKHLQSQFRILRHIVQKRCTDLILRFHFLCQMKGMEHIGHIPFVSLPAVCLKTDIHSPLRQIRIKHI